MTKSNNESDIYFATIAWDGMDDKTMGDRTITRMTLQHLVEDVEYYLHVFESRHPYIECASVELRDGYKTVSSKDLTGTVKTIIKKKEKDRGSK